ncbi:MAG: GNAT family N-acetyltransferase [Deltaproteobacteria bacterium]|nr:GNAT family N-acetyltransferase [Deltaproteobacteria bacterium]
MGDEAAVSYETLSPGDEARLDAFLARHAESSMFLRSNVRAAGFADQGALHQGSYAAAIRDGAIESVAGHFWNGVVVLQSPVEEHLPEVVALATATSHRPVAGIAGPWDQVVAARAALGMEEADTSRSSPETLYALSLAELRVPDALASGSLRCEVPASDRIEAAVAMRVAFCVEALGQSETPGLWEGAASELRRLVDSGSTFVLTHDARAVAVGSFNARLPDCVQLGGVFTPPELRGRGYARALVAGALLAARAEGVARAVLFTEIDNLPARRAYEALGFRAVGTYGLCLFR